MPRLLPLRVSVAIDEFPFFPLSVSVDVVGLVIIMMIIPTATATDDPIQFVYADMGVRLFTPGIMIDDQGGSFFLRGVFPSRRVSANSTRIDRHGQQARAALHMLLPHLACWPAREDEGAVAEHTLAKY